MLDNSQHLSDVKHALIGNGTDAGVLSQVKNMVMKSGLQTEDIKNLTMSALLMKLRENVSAKDDKDSVTKLLQSVSDLGIGKQLAEVLL